MIPETSQHNAPPVDILEENGHLILVMDMPGVKCEAVDVEIQGDRLTITGTTGTPRYRGRKLIHREFETTSYERTFVVSEIVDAKTAKAKFRNGFLRLELDVIQSFNF